LALLGSGAAGLASAGGAWLLSLELDDVVEACCADASVAFAVASCASAEVAVVGDLPRPPSPIAAAGAGVPLAGAGAAGCVLTTSATATGGIAGLAALALAAVVVVAASVAAVSSWLFLSPDDCFAESPVVVAVWSWPGTAACAMPFGFGAFVGAAEFESAWLLALVVVLFCAGGLLPLEGGGVVALEFVAGWLFGPSEVCAGAGLLLSVAGALDFELLFDWKALLCRKEPFAGAGGGFACALVCCWEAASSKAVNGWASACCAVGRVGDRCCDADCTNDDAELTSDAILGTARSLKANGRRSACNRRASRWPPTIA